MTQQERHRVGAPALLMDEMQVNSGKRHGELAEGVKLNLLRTPVEAVAPVFEQLL